MSRVPTVKRIGPYRFFFSSSDGVEPPHIHVQCEARVAKFWLDPPELAKPVRFVAHELRAIARLVDEHRKEFMEAWDDFFGS
jgi:Domain of unknown function (DUF4160)